MTRAFLLTLVLLTGCSSTELDLDPHWRPLERIVEVPGWPEGVATTIGTEVKTRSIGALRDSYPPGPEWDALLLHEQEHARRQSGENLALWIWSYARSPEFMWAEESRGWALQLLHLQKHGRRIVPEATAKALSSYKTAIGGQRMISYAEALAWVRDVLAGRWKVQ